MVLRHGRKHAADKHDFLTVVLHEIGHGLNFAGSMYGASMGGWGSDGDPYSYDIFARDGDGISLLDTGVYPNPSQALGEALRSDSVWFHGTHAMAANGGIRVKLYAPSTWSGGSSYSHFAPVFHGTADALMHPSLSSGNAIHSPGPVTLGLLTDLGWRTPWGAPVNVVASDSQYIDRVEVWWPTVSEATHYRVSRSTSATGGKIELGPWQTDTSFIDTGATAGTTYYYWVRAAKSSGGAEATGYSAYDTGVRAVWAPPSNVAATDGAFLDRVEVTWNGVVHATHYRVSRATSPSGTKLDLGSWQAGTSFTDTGAAAGTTYYYWVRAATGSGGENATDFSDYNTGVRAVWGSPPSNVYATDGAHLDRVEVTWNGVVGATHYLVSRADSASGGKNPLGSWQAGTSYSDSTATLGSTHYYWVQAATSSAGANATPYSTADTGSRAQSLPPAYITASNGTYTDRVHVNWGRVTWATHYRVSRAESAGGEKTELGVWQTGIYFEDSSATAGITYHYWVRAATGNAGQNASPYSNADTGWRSLPAPAAPTGVAATDGTIGGQVQVTWSSVPGASHYRVSRSVGAGGDKSELGPWQTGTSFSDATATPGVTYHYWLRSSEHSTGDNPSDHSAPDTGWRALPIPAGVAASDGTDTAKVRVTWFPAAGATHYRVSRSDTIEGSAKLNLSGWQTATNYNDTAAMPGNDRYYWVQAATSAAGANASAYSAPDVGWVGLSAPGGVVASDGLYTDRVQVNWQMPPGAMRHRLSRSESLEGPKTVVLDWQAALSFSDTTAVPGKLYHYWAQAAMDDAGARASAYAGDGGWRGLIHLGSALDSLWSFASDGGAAWFGQSAVSHDSVAAGQSGAITHGQNSRLVTWPEGPGQLSFWWKVSSELGYDRLFFSVDEATQTVISGERDWEHVTHTLAAGPHTVIWTYAKDNGVSAGSDCGWLDQVAFTPAPSAPATLGASDGAYTDRIVISWAAAAGATHYLLSRSDSLAGAKTALGTWQAGTAYTDLTPAPGAFHYYWVQAAMDDAGLFASGYSAADQGYRALEAPTGVSATDGAHAGFVRLTWNSAFGATHYRVWRAETFGGYKTALGGLLTERTYDDTSAAAGRTYFYWVLGVAQSGEGLNESAYGAYDDGFHGLSLSEALDTPGRAWSAGGDTPWAGQTAVTHDGADAAQSGVIAHSQAVWMETVVEGPGNLSFCWKTSSESGYDWLEFHVDGVLQDRLSGEQEWQGKTYFLPAGTRTLRWNYRKDDSVTVGSDCGWVDEVSFAPALPAPAGVAAGDGTHADRVQVAWSAVPGATHYRVSRAEGAEGARTDLGAWQPGTGYGDATAASGVTYHYWVRAAAGAGGELASLHGGPDTGWREAAARPDFVVQSIVLDPETVAAGGTVTATVTVRNQGAAGGSAGWLDGYVNRPETATGPEGEWWQSVGELAAGATNVFRHSFTAPAAGVRVYRAVVDSAGQAEEESEGNNQATAAYSVVFPYGGGYYRIWSEAPAEVMELRLDGTLVWRNAVLGLAGRVQAATTLASGGDWTDIAEFVGTELIMSRQVFVP